MLRWLLLTPIVALLVIFSLSIYLEPNSFKHCQSQPSDSGECAKGDVIVAISGGDTTARTNAAIELYKNGWADKILFSGAALDKTGPSNAVAMKAQALEAGIPKENILIDETSETTKQNASNTQTLIAKEGFDNIILVTSAYHQRRAFLEFDKRIDDSVAIRNYPAKNDKDWFFWWWLTPRGWTLAISEMVKIVALPTEVSR